MALCQHSKLSTTSWFAKNRPWMKMNEPLKYEQYNGYTWIIVTINLQTHITNGLALYSGDISIKSITRSQWPSISFLYRRSITGQIYWVKSLTQIRVIIHWECIYVFLSEMICAISQKLRKITYNQLEWMLPFSITPGRRGIKEVQNAITELKPLKCPHLMFLLLMKNLRPREVMGLAELY